MGFELFHWIGIVLLVISLGGLLYCKKMQKANPAMQSLAAVFGVVMLVGIGLYIYQEFFTGDVAMKMEQKFALSRVAMAGKAVKDAGASGKVLYIVEPNWDKYPENKANIEKQIEVFKEQSGCSDVIIASVPVPKDYEESGMSREDVYTPQALEKLLKEKNPAIVVSEISLPGRHKGKTGVRLFANKKAPKLFLLSTDNLEEDEIENLFSKGNLIGLISYKQKADYEAKPKGDFAETFAIRYELRTK